MASVPHLEDKNKIIYKAVVRLLTHHSEQKFSLEISVEPGQNQNSVYPNINYPVLNLVTSPLGLTRSGTQSARALGPVLCLCSVDMAESPFPHRSANSCLVASPKAMCLTAPSMTHILTWVPGFTPPGIPRRIHIGSSGCRGLWKAQWGQALSLQGMR